MLVYGMRAPAGAKKTFEGVEFLSPEIEFVMTKELLRRVKEIERREMELIRMWREVCAARTSRIATFGDQGSSGAKTSCAHD
jgi:hypothetical protein